MPSMNKKARLWECSILSLPDPAGSDATNVASAEDCFNWEVSPNNRSFVLKLTTGELNCTAYGEAYRNLENYNLFGGDPSFLGGKIGKTLAAKETMLAVFDVPFGNTLRPVIIIVLGSDDVGQDISTIRSYIQANYRGQFSLR